MNLITRANQTQMEVEKKMCDALNELFAEELKEADAHGRSIGRAEGRANGIKLTKQVFRLSAAGETTESIARKCDITPEEVLEILE